MKILLLAVIPLLGLSEEKRLTSDSAIVAKMTEESAFGLEAARKLADERRRELHGECGMCIFKERIGDAWVFRTKVGYAGLPAADITVFPPAKISAPEREEGRSSRYSATPLISPESPMMFPLHMAPYFKSDGSPARRAWLI